MAVRALTTDDLAYYQITYLSGTDTNHASIIAAYITTEGHEPGWLVLKDHEHRAVAQFNANTVIMAQRGNPADGQDAPAP